MTLRKKIYKPWEERFSELAVYKEKNGDCNVPKSQGALGRWVDTQRQPRTKGKLSREHAEQLKGIGFNWDTQKKSKDKRWEERFNELAAHKEKNGDCNVTPKQGALIRWVYNQRQYFKEGKLSQERTTALDGIGFNWGAQKKDKDKPGTWVINQRQRHKKMKLSREHATQLRIIEFVWKPKRGTRKASTWEERFNELAAYKEVNGDCNVPQSQGALKNG